MMLVERHKNMDENIRLHHEWTLGKGSGQASLAAPSGSEAPTPRTNNLLMQMKLTPEYTKEKETDRDRALNLCRSLERELITLGKQYKHSMDERYDLNIQNQKLRGELNKIRAGLPNDKLCREAGQETP